MTIRCISIDDEPLSLAKINGFIAQVPYLELIASFPSAVEALAFLKENHADLLFLDVQMETLTGIQLLEILDPKPAVILATAYDQYAMKGYELNVSDYLLKPYSFDRFLKAVEKVFHQLQVLRSEPEKDNFIFLKTDYRLEKVSFDDILYIESRGDYVYVKLPQSKVLTLMTLKGMMSRLPADQFIRVHKSFIVAINKITSIEGNQIRIKDISIPIGDTFKESVWKRLVL